MTNLPQIVIHTDLDLTPAGKRTARVVKLTRCTVLRWYVSGRIYSTRPVTNENMKLTQEWIAA